MNLVGVNTDRFMFQFFVREVNEIYDSHMNDIRNFIDEQRLLGLTDADIMRRLENDLENQTGIYADLENRMNGSMSDAVNKSFQLSSNQFEDLGTMVRWELDPTAEHCDSCLYQSARGTLSIDQFPIPGFQPTHGETNCEMYCKCQLIPTGE